MKKRYFLQAGVAAVGAAALSRYLFPRSQAQQAQTQSQAGGAFEVSKTEAEWRNILTPEQFKVLRSHGTEPPFSSSLDKQFVKGTYICAGCDLPLFDSETKFDSGTGWPSFYQPIAGAIGTSEDSSLMMTRTEVHCRRCGGHLGHVFDDGPQPTGQRYCINGIALKFVAS
jgi:peptide-methionine (R)-S-oxide reductase